MTNVNSEQSVEIREKWAPVEGIVTPAASALIVEDRDGLTVTLLFSDIVDGSHSDLCLKFGRVLAYTVYEEFVHPGPISESAPRLAGQWERYCYPLLRISESRWIASLPDLLAIHPGAIHYQLVTADQIVDVLGTKPPEVSWTG
ncbi:MAG TPA: hypothetical protein VN844_24200 [Pyrinomonadaceae bacterium]|nr:hypothetical protein [Pyrinomonadaceae bacterium]